VPSSTWNAFYSLFVPLAVLLLGAQLSLGDRIKLLPWLLALGLFSGLWGIVQVVGAHDGPFYLYDVTNYGSAVGLFSNRNHQAMLLACLFPMLAVYASTSIRSEEQASLRRWIAIGAGTVLVPLLLVTGSRAGLILGVVGLLSVVVLYRKPASLTPTKRKNRKIDLRYAVTGFGVLCLGALTIIMSRAEAFQRLFAAGQGEDERLKIWVPIAQMAWKYFPFGSGIGSFVEVYQINEPRDLLSHQYYNHAHNDWLEVYLTVGLLGVLILSIALLGWFRTSWKALMVRADNGRGVLFSRLGSVIVLMMALGSIGDYPLRVPSLACLFVVASLWLADEVGSLPKSSGTLSRSKLGTQEAV
jgi:O-antigen ligase